jgi:hypothetical protein
LTKILGENGVTEAGKGLEYVSKTRDVIADMQKQINLGQTGQGSMDQLEADIALLKEHFNAQVFQGDAAASTFKQFCADIDDVKKTLQNKGWSIADLWKISKQGPSGNPEDTQTATDMLTKLSNAMDTEQSNTSVSTGNLNTKMQAKMGDIKSLMGLLTNGFMKVMNSLVAQTLKSA